MEDQPQPSERLDQKAYTIQQAAAAYGVSTTVIRAQIKHHRLIARYPTSRPIIGAQELEDWFEALPTEPPKS